VTCWRRLPIPVPPARHETVASYLARLANLHGLDPGELWQQASTPQPGTRRRVINPSLLAAITGRPAEHLARALPELRRPGPDWPAWRHQPQPGCPRCDARHDGGPVTRLLPHHRYVCARHRYWTGPPDAGQPATPLGPELAGIVQAQRRHLRLLRRHGPAATYDAVLTGFLLCGHLWTDQAAAGVAGELAEEPVRGWLSRVVAGEEGLDGDLLVALGGVARPDVLQGAGDGGHRDGDERPGGVVAGLGGDLEPVAFPSGVALAPPSRAGERGVGGAGLPVAGGRELGDAVGVEREVGDVLAGQAAVRRLQVEGIPAGVQDGDQVEQAERGDACQAGFLPQGVVVAPEGELAVLGNGDRVGRGAGRRGQLACLRGGRRGLELLGPGDEQFLLLGDEGTAVDGAVWCQRGAVGGG